MAVAPQRLPIPSQPAMPPSGLAPVTQEVGLGAGDDAMSPTTMVLNYLKARGYTPSSENVRRALEANQRDPGVITGLRSDRPATDEEDQAAMAAARSGAGAKPTPYVPSGTGGPNDTTPIVGGDPNTSAPPPGMTPPGAPSIAGSIINGIPLALAGGAGAYGMYRAAQNMNRPDPNISLPPTIPAPTDPIHGPGQIDYTQMDPAARPEYPTTPMPTPTSRPGQIDYTQLTPPTQSGGSLGSALDRAVPSTAPPIDPLRPAAPPAPAVPAGPTPQERTQQLLDAARATQVPPPAARAPARGAPRAQGRFRPRIPA